MGAAVKTNFYRKQPLFIRDRPTFYSMRTTGMYFLWYPPQKHVVMVI